MINTIEDVVKRNGLFCYSIPKEEVSFFNLIYGEGSSYFLITNYSLLDINQIKDNKTCKNLIIRITPSDCYYHVVRYSLGMNNNAYFRRIESSVLLPLYLEKRLVELLKKEQILNEAQLILNLIEKEVLC